MYKYVLYFESVVCGGQMLKISHDEKTTYSK